MAKRGELSIEGAETDDRSKGEAGTDASTAPSDQETAAQDKSRSQRSGSDGSYHYDPPPRRPQSERENAFSAVAWLLEGALGIGEELRHNDLGLSEEFWVHAYTARREFLLAIRELVDATIQRCDRETQRQEEKQKRQERRGQVNIDF